MQVFEITPQMKKPSKIRLAAYCRVSSDSKDQLHSFAAQVKYYSEYVRRNPIYSLVDIYADEGLTGTEVEKRDELNRLLRDCKNGRIDKIIVKSVSRFMRNTEELLVTLRMLKDVGVSVYFEEQGIDTNKLNSEMIVTFPGMLAQQESLNISGNLRWGIKKRMEKGEYICTQPAYGYSLINCEIVINEEEAAIVRRIFNLYLSGMSSLAITKLLNREGIRKGRKGKKWLCTSIQYILCNEKYIGDALLGKSYTLDGVPFIRKKNKGEHSRYYVEGYCPQIIPKDMFDAVQKLFNSRKFTQKEKVNHLLTKKLRCSDCNCTFRSLTTNGKKYWSCAQLLSGKTNCKSKRVRESAVFESFTNMVYRLTMNKQTILDNVIQWIECLQDKVSSNRDMVRQIDKEIADKSAKILVIAKLHSNGIMATSEYQGQVSQINSQISQLRSKRQELFKDKDQQLEQLKSLSDILEEYRPNGIFDSELFTEIVEYITVIDNATLIFHLIGGLNFTEHIREKERCNTK